MSPNERLDDHLAALRSASARFQESAERWRRENDDSFRDSMIQRFEFTFELCWKAMRDWLRIWEGDLSPSGPRQVIEAAVARNLVLDGNVWTAMLERRNRTVHIYNEAEIALIAAWIADNAPEPINALVERLSGKV